MGGGEHASTLNIKMDATRALKLFLMFFCAPNCLSQVQLALGEKKKLLIEALENVKIQTR